MNKMLETNDPWYRVDRILYHACDCDDACHHPARPAMTVTTYYVTRITPKGVWLSLNPIDTKGNMIRVLDTPKWVSHKSTKRFACPTLEQAYESFLARKQAQMRIYEREMYYLNKLIAQAKNKIKELQEAKPVETTI